MPGPGVSAGDMCVRAGPRARGRLRAVDTIEGSQKERSRSFSCASALRKRCRLIYRVEREGCVYKADYGELKG